jgi:hypothetical protein
VKSTTYTGPYSLLAFGLVPNGETAPTFRGWSGQEPPPIGDGNMPDAVVNLTPHPLVYQPEINGHAQTDSITIPSHGVARIEEISEPGSPLCGWVPDCTGAFPVKDVNFGRIVGLPEPSTLAHGERRVYFVVSLVTALALRASGSTRTDVLYPADQVRAPGGSVTSAFRTFGRVL